MHKYLTIIEFLSLRYGEARLIKIPFYSYETYENDSFSY